MTKHSDQGICRNFRSVGYLTDMDKGKILNKLNGQPMVIGSVLGSQEGRDGRSSNSHPLTS